jgi:transposase-like protein
MSTKKKAADKGKRYTEQEKAEILAWADAQGRGGQTKAAAKFKVSPLTISNWRKGNYTGHGKTEAHRVGNGAPASAPQGLELEIAAAKWLNKQGFTYELFQSLSSGAIDRKLSKSLEGLGLFGGGDYTVSRIGKGGEPVVEISLSKLLELTKTKA